MTVLLGDTHGCVERVAVLDEQMPEGEPILSVGDLGWWPQEIERWVALGKALRRTLYWIDGNHEHFPSVPLDATDPVEVAPNIIYVPRGTVLELDGLRIGCLGGAASVDYRWRTLGFNWFAEEAIRPQDEAKALAWAPVDVMVTHTPPEYVKRLYFPASGLIGFGLPMSWRDPSAMCVQRVWEKQGKPPLVCGHMHRPITHDTVRMLDINEALPLSAVPLNRPV